MKKSIPFIFVLGFIIFLGIKGFDKLNGLKIFGLSLGLLISVYLIFMAITEKYIDFKDGLKLKKIEKK